MSNYLWLFVYFNLLIYLFIYWHILDTCVGIMYTHKARAIGHHGIMTERCTCARARAGAVFFGHAQEIRHQFDRGTTCRKWLSLREVAELLALLQSIMASAACFLLAYTSIWLIEIVPLRKEPTTSRGDDGCWAHRVKKTINSLTAGWFCDEPQGGSIE